MKSKVEVLVFANLFNIAGNLAGNRFLLEISSGWEIIYFPIDSHEFVV